MPRTWSFTLNYPKPLPGMSANDGHGQRWARTRNTKIIREQVYRTVQAMKIPKLNRIRVDIEWVVSVKRGRDVTNLGLWTKPIYDGICASHEPSAHVVADDTSEYLDAPLPTITHQPGKHAHFVVIITEVTND